MPKPPPAPPTPSAKQRQILKTLRNEPDARIEWARNNAWLSCGEEDEKLLPSTFDVLLCRGWIELRRPRGSMDGWLIYVVSPAGEEALK
jgi:hypothetical protein